jgi:hypothetical protein
MPEGANFKISNENPLLLIPPILKVKKNVVLEYKFELDPITRAGVMAYSK